MVTQDTCCSVAPYVKVHPGKLELFRALCERFVEKTSKESGCLYYGSGARSNKNPPRKERL